MSIVYNGAHSITFRKYIPEDPTGNTYYDANTWTYFHMVPATRPYVVSPEPRLQFVNIPRSNKILDVTNALTSDVTYEASEGDWEFYIDHEQWLNYEYPFDRSKDWVEAFDAIFDFFDGSWFDVWLDDQLNYKYSGRVYANVYRPEKDYSRINLHYSLEVNLYDTEDWYDGGGDTPPGPSPDPDPDPQPVDYLVTDYEDDLIMKYELMKTGTYSNIPLYVEQDNRAYLKGFGNIENYKISLTPSWDTSHDSTTIQGKYIIVRVPKSGGGSTYEANALSRLNYDSETGCYVTTFESSILRNESGGNSTIYVASDYQYNNSHSIHCKIEHLNSGGRIIT